MEVDDSYREAIKIKKQEQISVPSCDETRFKNILQSWMRGHAKRDH